MSTPTPGPAEEYLASPDDLALKLGVAATDPSLLLALRRASDRFEGAIEYPIRLKANDVAYISGDGSASLLLPARPVIGDPVVKVDGVTVTDYSVGRSNGLLRRKGGKTWPDDLDNVEVTYTHGYAVVPGDIADAVLEQAEAAYNVEVALQSRTAGAESITYSATAAVGVTQKWADAVARYRLRGDEA